MPLVLFPRPTGLHTGKQADLRKAVVRKRYGIAARVAGNGHAALRVAVGHLVALSTGVGFGLLRHETRGHEGLCLTTRLDIIWVAWRLVGLLHELAILSYHHLCAAGTRMEHVGLLLSPLALALPIRTFVAVLCLVA